ncbi:MAG: acetoacetate--CoA ligase [Oligoflexales bacterium]|nr:acetoacetate--CoA ligase [Oligoflexales bacterium]
MSKQDLSSFLWEASPERKKNSQILAFWNFAQEKSGRSFGSWDELHGWSIEDQEGFWGLLQQYCSLKWISPPSQTCLSQFERTEKTPFPLSSELWGVHWFPGARLNYCENLLPSFENPDRIIITSYLENKSPLRVSVRRFYEELSCLSAELKRLGVRKGDRVAGVLANTYHAILAFLASASLGAVWSSCSPDFGVEGICERLGQVEPKVLFFTRAYSYDGKIHNCHSVIENSLQRLPSIHTSIAVDLGYGSFFPSRFDCLSYEELVPGTGLMEKALPLFFEPMAFDDPLYILFTSGTTGLPKCLVHRVGGSLLQQKKELMLHCDVKNGDKLFFYTTCGWMMWNWMVTALAVGASLLTYEGSPAYPSSDSLWQIADQEGLAFLGTSPKFLGSCLSQKLSPKASYRFDQLRAILSTGSPLMPEQARWVYEHVKGDIHLASISGGTDIVSCFILGNPLLPVHAGEIQALGLGMAVEIWDEDGRRLDSFLADKESESGELVCTKPFVSMPIFFLNDAEGRLYRKVYFEYYIEQGREVWRHGDLIQRSENGGILVQGRSDATLKAGGVRIGTAEIYRCLESYFPEFEDSAAVEYKMADGDGVIILFVKTSGPFLQGTEQKLKQVIRKQLSPRHVPKWVYPVQDIPYTRNGKKLELAIRHSLRGEQVKNLQSIKNPQALEEYVRIGAVLRDSPLGK